MEVGNAVGYNIALLDNKGLLIIIGFIIGVVTVLAEPAACVFADEVEQVTNGNLKRSVVLFRWIWHCCHGSDDSYHCTTNTWLHLQQKV